MVVWLCNGAGLCSTFFDIIFDDPQRVISLLSHYIVDYQTMTGDAEAVGRFRTILQALVERENPGQA